MKPVLTSLPDLFAWLFIARPDVKAIQSKTGEYYTDVVDRRADPLVYKPWSREALEDHITGVHTYGHYLLGQDNTCKVMAFDIDLKQTGFLPTVEFPWENPDSLNYKDMSVVQNDMARRWDESFKRTDLRAAWLDRSHVARPYIKYSMRLMGHYIQRAMTDLDIPTAVAYTGAKGLHVYGFTGKMPAKDVRAGMQLVLDDLPLEPSRGKVFYEWDSTEPKHIQPELDLFSVEVFPKQDEVSKTAGFGNLMRLPLGKNQKSPDPTFFVDTNQPLGVLAPIEDPVTLLQDIMERMN